jgi:hypothetical protein
MSDPKQVEDVGDDVQVKERKTKRQLQKEREDEEMKQILDTYGGRAFMWRLLSSCGVFRTSFTGNASTYFNEGKRQIGLEVLKEILELDSKAFQIMQQEAVERDKRK